MTYLSYHWEIQPMEEVDPYIIYTKTDSVLQAVKQFEETWGLVSVSSVRKVGIMTHFKFDKLEGVS